MKSQNGFTLIEVLLGVALALLGIVAMFQVQDNWARQKRSISSGGDAHISGSVSAFRLERDIRNAGMGFGNSGFLGCNALSYDANRIGVKTFSLPLIPVRIVQGAGGAPDEIHVLYGNSEALSSDYSVLSTDETFTMLLNRGGLGLGETVVVATAAGCRLAEITGNTNADGQTVDHNSTPYTRNSVVITPRYNSATPLGVVPATNGSVHVLGRAPVLNVWAVRARTALTQFNALNAEIAGDVGDGAVDLQAQYGLDTNGDTTIDTWQDADPAAWTQLRMIRFGLLVRGENYEKEAVTTANPAWLGGNFTMTNLDGSADSGAGSLGVNNWRNYRYNVFEVAIPLRNMIWTNRW
ncbi:MAG: PilW family protein [Burkholderiaceae bacterium]|nr:PilW family protein [Sulfuritalea sp.]MCF8174672.1 PilW family protein [Burkholderiaceae bacterium]